MCYLITHTKTKQPWKTNVASHLTSSGAGGWKTAQKQINGTLSFCLYDRKKHELKIADKLVKNILVIALQLSAVLQA